MGFGRERERERGREAREREARERRERGERDMHKNGYFHRFAAPRAAMGFSGVQEFSAHLKQPTPRTLQ